MKKSISFIALFFAIFSTLHSQTNYAFDLSANRNSAIAISNETDISAPWTVEFWVYKKTTTGYSSIISSANFKINLETYGTSQKVGITKLGSFDASFNYIVPLAAWTHLAFTCNGTKTYLYVNGTLTDSLNKVISMPMHYIGNSLQSESPNGYVDEIRFWNEVRTQSQISQYMNAEIPFGLPHLIGYWRGNDQASPAVDGSIGRRTGQLLNGASYISSDNSNFKVAVGGSAPSAHLTFYGGDDAVLKINKVQIAQSYFDDYYETQSFGGGGGGYAGLQHTADSSKTGSSHTFIFSLWDPNTDAGIYSTVDYLSPSTYTQRFGGEGDGCQTLYPLNWKTGTWYNTVVRSWISKGRLHIAAFVQNLSTNNWIHVATLSAPSTGSYMGSGNDAFIENWVSSGSFAGQTVRKMFIKDVWNLTAKSVWQQSNNNNFSANTGKADSTSSGQYYWSFNSGYDSAQGAYFMQHGGNTLPNSAFNGSRSLNLPAQTGQGSAPTLSTGSVLSVSAFYNNGKTIVNWVTDSTKGPQLSAKVDIINAAGSVVATFIDTLPERRSDTIVADLLNNTSYTARVSIVDIFNQSATSVNYSFNTSTVSTAAWYKIRNLYSGKYLSVANNSVNNSANIVQYTSSSSYSEQWQFVGVGSSYQLINRASGKAIDISGSIQTQGVQPIQYTSTGNINQQWNLINTGANTYTIQSNMSNHYVLDGSTGSVSDSSAIIIYTSGGNTGQQWVTEQVVSNNTLSDIKESNNIQILKQKKSVEIWPNPVRTNLNIKVNDELINTPALIYNAGGSIVKKIEIKSTKITISVSDLTKGVYFIKFDNDTSLSFEKQ